MWPHGAAGGNDHPGFGRRILSDDGHRCLPPRLHPLNAAVLVNVLAPGCYPQYVRLTVLGHDYNTVARRRYVTFAASLMQP